MKKSLIIVCTFLIMITGCTKENKKENENDLTVSNISCLNNLGTTYSIGFDKNDVATQLKLEIVYNTKEEANNKIYSFVNNVDNFYEFVTVQTEENIFRLSTSSKEAIMGTTLAASTSKNDIKLALEQMGFICTE